MDTASALQPFLHEFSRLTAHLQGVVSGVDKLGISDNPLDYSERNSDEVYAGLPTAFNSRRLADSIKECVERLSASSLSPMKGIRPLLTKMECLAVIANTYGHAADECHVWESMFTVSEQSGRFLDTAFSHINRLLAKLLAEEEKVSDATALKSTAALLVKQLKEQSGLLDAVSEAALTGQLPTPHAHFQSIFVDIGSAYLECYFDWPAFSARMSLVPFRYVDFFVGKSWAAVCARGYFYWFDLHARCLFGATNLPHRSQFTSTSETSPPVVDLPDSVLHAAVIVRMHGRTLVQFMRQCCESRLSKIRQKLIAEREDNKENAPNAANKPFVEPDCEECPKTSAWGSSRLSDSELLNIWLGTRLLVRGCLQVAELYTLHGSVREARAYQDELLRVSQRFHIPACAQTALSLMAHLDLFAQRKWAFELRLRQLHHIATCTMSLEEIFREKKRFQTDVESKRDLLADEAGDSAFLHSDDSTSIASQHQTATKLDDESGFEGVSTDTLSAASNPLIAANVHAFASIFPCSPTRARNYRRSTKPECFPTFSQIVSLITGTSSRSSRRSTAVSESNKGLQTLDDTLLSVGGLSLTTCVYRILNGVTWPWLVEIIRLVREELLSDVHYLPAAMATDRVEKVHQMTEKEETEALLTALASLTASPSKTTGESNSSRNLTQNVMNSEPDHDPGHSENLLHTGRTMLPPPPPPNAPRRLADRRRSPRDAAESAFCQPRTVRAAQARKHKHVADVEPMRTEVAARNNTPVCPRRTRSAALPKRAIHQDVVHRPIPHSDAEQEYDDSFLLTQLGYRVAPSKPIFNRPRPMEFYVDNDGEPTRSKLQDGGSMSTSNATASRPSDRMFDPVESCPSLTGVPARPRNLRLASKWGSAQLRSTHGMAGPEPPLTVAGTADVGLLQQQIASAEECATKLADRLTVAYNQLSGLPVPNLLRPICHWLGLRWLSRGSQGQAGRYFAQSVGIAPTSLFTSILSSRLSESKTSCSSNVPSAQVNRWFEGYRRIVECCAPYNPLANQEKLTGSASSDQRFITVIQLCLVDEVAVGLPSADVVDDTSPDCVALGLGAKSNAHLVVTKYTGVSGLPCSELYSESRVMHRFTNGGLKLLDAFDELQVESLDSMQIQDRVRYWRTRYKLDTRLENMLSEIRRELFTPDDLRWLLGQPVDSGPVETVRHESGSIVLVLDRRLIYLPWEWIFWGTEVEVNQPSQHHQLVPNITRSFSLPLVIAHLATQQEPNTFTFDPRQTYYVLNPEANLSFTQQMFQPLFERFLTWRGVVGREPTAAEVNVGFTDHELLIYLGHGNGSRFLLHTFNQGLNARAAALVLGCSSGKPRWEGRHEPYSSLFNHLLAGCPFVAGLLWDVTDRDMDRFTLQFFKQWLFTDNDSGADENTISNSSTTNHNKPPISTCLVQATSACKLKHLVGKSVIIYGIPAEPLLRLPLKCVDASS
ncbi:hypothetical protein CSKR_113627 [Clonorchis sinensis]|uniref:separase n=1 Tax=Clonorchis sinensis TaxID=79923 RepID=A0A8T1M249_CLOSI|nr:hypothetical protein CSKR_113627 [Clonorchis sinensis]